MQSARSLAVVGLSLLISMGCVNTARSGGGMPSCTGGSNCVPDSTPATVIRTAPESLLCTFPDSTESLGPTTISDLSDGVSSDGRGPYIQGTEGVGGSAVGNAAGLGIRPTESTRNPRKLTVNLNNPAPGGRGVPLGIITDGVGLHTQWHQVGNAVQNLHNIPVGQTVTAAQMNVVFIINGHLHILQMGPQANGHCHSGSNLVNGTGTSTGTIYRASKTKWVMNLPAGSVGRLFDLNNQDWEHAVDKGLYYVRLHYEIGN